MGPRWPRPLRTAEHTVVPAPLLPPLVQQQGVAAVVATEQSQLCKAAEMPHDGRLQPRVFASEGGRRRIAAAAAAAGTMMLLRTVEKRKQARQGYQKGDDGK